MNLEFLTTDVQSISPFLENIFIDGGRKKYGLEGVIRPVIFNDGMSGFEYKLEEADGLLQIGLILGGTGYSMKRVLHFEGQLKERHDYFDMQGEFTFSAEKEALRSLIVDFHEMDQKCPILNHLYNFLSMEYKNAKEGRSLTKTAHSVEKLLRQMYNSRNLHLAIQDKTRDAAITNIYHKILQAESDPVLTWEERQLVFSNYKKELKEIVSTKIRAHKLSNASFKISLFLKNIECFLTRVIARPLDNLMGLLYRYTIGKVIWFFQTVKNNLGYSIALAVYGPFTYYFITMPMNPHAMQAVGRVRSAYLQTMNEISRLVDSSDVVVNDFKSKEAIAAPRAVLKEDINTDSISTKMAAPGNIILPSSITSGQIQPTLIDLGNGGTEKAMPSILNMLLTTDSEQTNKTPWSERMSHFKQMQIAYEENIEFASRMGRLEQLETQYNFPMQVEAAWEEMERYNHFIFKLREENPNMTAKMKQFLVNEINRTQQLELYLWDRMGRFILDQIYVMLDQDQEQKRNNYYVGRSFVFMEEMTNILSWRYEKLKRPEGYEKIEKLSALYKASRKEFGSVMRNLNANSDLFKQKDIYNTQEFRGYMKRQWEILFLQNAKAQEASNMGLNMYIWSVRNTVWVLQSLYSAKREEIALLIKRDVSGKLLTPSEMLGRSKISMLYETMFHNLNLEYVGIREEIKNHLGRDIESSQRMTVIENIKEFLSDREKLENPGMASNKSTAGAKI